jgi:putative sigma-54 modulation protein
MELSIFTRKLDMTPRLREYAESKVEKLDRYLPTIEEARLDLEVEDTRSDEDRQVAQLTVWTRGSILRAEERSSDMFASIVEEGSEGEIVRVKRFEVRPMTPQEAIEQMELLGHHFFVFLNAEEGTINTVYKRRDGNYGLLQPQVG